MNTQNVIDSLTMRIKNKAMKAFVSDDWEEAIKLYNVAIELEPNNEMSLRNRSFSYANLRRLEQALDDANKCIELNPELSLGYGCKGYAYAKMNEYQTAHKIFQRGMEYCEDCGPILVCSSVHNHGFMVSITENHKIYRN